MRHSSIIELSQEALANNLAFIRHISGNSLLSSVVKGNAYGHGIEVFVPMAEACGITHFSVYSADEAFRVKQCAKNNPDIMIMGDADGESLKWAISHGISFFVFEFDRLKQAINYAAQVGEPAFIHIELETGMNRTGFNKEELPSVLELFLAHPNELVLNGLCTHFAGAESIANYVRNNDQKKIYLQFCDWFKEKGLTPRLRHTCCSAATVRFPEMAMDMVRIGILQYGFWPSQEVYIEYLSRNELHEDPLRRVITWKSRVMSLKNVSKGEFIGYGTTYLATRHMQIAILPIGYSHGFSRSLSNQGRVLIKGQRVPVVGMVNMNCIAVEVSQIAGVKVGEEAMLIGQQGGVALSVASFGELSEQLNYELLTRLPQNIPRYVSKGQLPKNQDIDQINGQKEVSRNI